MDCYKDDASEVSVDWEKEYVGNAGHRKYPWQSKIKRGKDASVGITSKFEREHEVDYDDGEPQAA